ncbi:MAG: N-acetylmuramoyl-L-alanine amidase [Lachnospiraceae bacterium]|nr:N-acetylmuramoyl-L-alanine amidase [Lachnospiraceae bacterium]
MPITIALDPGHGGGNNGLQHEGMVEKYMTRVTAQAMKQELETYENVEVIITDPDAETDMSLSNRADTAKQAGADVLISLHFNMSEEHTMFGSEVWIPSKGLNYAQMRSLGELVLDEFSDIGLTRRGTKVRLNDRGTDYYGIIRESVVRNMPAILIEHCYADHEQDAAYIEGEANWEAFGKMDATAVAKYYHLKSKDGTKDFTEFVKDSFMVPDETVEPDKSGPEEVNLTWLAEGEYDANETGLQTYHICGNEPETSIVYYDYSHDGGQTWSGLQPFAAGETQMDIQIPDVKPGDQIVAKLYNGYTASGTSNVISYRPAPEAEQVDADRDLESLDAAYETSQSSLATMERAVAAGKVWSIAGSALALFCAMGFVAVALEARKKRRKQQRLMVAWAVSALFLLAGAWAPRYFLQQARDEAKLVSEQALNAREEARKVNAGHDALRTQQELEARELILTDAGESRGEYIPKQEVKTVTVYDIANGYMRVPLVEGIRSNPYRLDAFSGEGRQKTYDGGKAIFGIDVSKFQGDIDWQTVAASGVKFAIIRMGARGYETGELVTDDKFLQNIEGATEAGIKVGVYFFSTAVTAKEAVEEANYVIDAVAGYQLAMPVVLDTEIVLAEGARNADVTPAQLTEVSKAFCDRIKAEGLTPMIYSNAKRFTTRLYLEQLEEYDKWLADYREKPDYPYDFKMWQYSETGSVPGISGNVDLNLYFE